MFSIRRHRREIPDLNVVPILDMLISVIFFLLLTTTFLALTKEDVPPSAVSTITSPIKPPPVSAKMVAIQQGDKTQIMLTWAGAHPGREKKEVDNNKDPLSDDTRKAVLQAAQDLANEFNTKFPDEKTLQLGLGADVPYQDLMTIMDGVKEKLPDIVLFDYKEADIRGKKVFE